eukprot:4275643-Pyramimonas_sp.AAC.1
MPPPLTPFVRSTGICPLPSCNRSGSWVYALSPHAIRPIHGYMPPPLTPLVVIVEQDWDIIGLSHVLDHNKERHFGSFTNLRHRGEKSAALKLQRLSEWLMGRALTGR